MSFFLIVCRAAATERHGSISEADSDEENEEGDYTVYECPGLAPVRQENLFITSPVKVLKIIPTYRMIYDWKEFVFISNLLNFLCWFLDWWNGSEESNVPGRSDSGADAAAEAVGWHRGKEVKCAACMRIHHPHRIHRRHHRNHRRFANDAVHAHRHPPAVACKRRCRRTAPPNLTPHLTHTRDSHIS